MNRLRSALWVPLFDDLADPRVVARLAADAEEAWRRVWNAFPRGQSVDFRTALDEDASTGAD